MIVALAFCLIVAAPDSAVDGDLKDVDGITYVFIDGEWLPLDDIPDKGETKVTETAPLGGRPGNDVVTADVISSDDLKKMGVRTLSDLLRQQAGVQVNTSVGLGEEVIMDGLDGKHVLIMIDGRPVQGKVNNRVDVSRIPISAEAIKKVEIVRGPMSAVYGSEAMGGVINIITKKPSQKPTADVSIMSRLGLAGYHDETFTTRASAGAGPLGVSVEANGTRSSTLDRAAAGQVSDGNGDVPERGVMGARADVRFVVDDDTAVRAYASAQSTTSHSRPSSRVPLADRNANGQAELGARFERTLAAGHDLFVDARATQFQHYFSKVSAQATAVRTDTRQLEARGEARLTSVFATDQPLMQELSGAAGVVVTREAVHRRDGEGKDGVPGATARIVPAAYAEALWSPWTFLSISPGVRLDSFVDDVNANGFSMSPKLGAKLDLPASFAVRASYGQGFRLPTFEERFLLFDHSELGYVVEGNAALVPERSHGARASLSYTPTFSAMNSSVKLNAEVSGFVNLLENLISETATSLTTDAGVPIFSYQNSARAVTVGSNARVGVKVNNDVSVDVSYQYLALATDASSCPDDNPWFCDATQGARTLPLRPTHTLHALGSWTVPATGTTLFVRADAMDDRIVDATTIAPGSVDLGFGVTQQLTSHAELMVAADNLFDAYDPTFGPKPGRIIRARLSASF